MQAILSPWDFLRATSLGNSFTHGGQEVLQKSTTTTLPVCRAISASSPAWSTSRTLAFPGAWTSVWAGAWAPAGAANTPARTSTVPSQAPRRDNRPHDLIIPTAPRSAMATSRFVHLRHKAPDTFAVPRELIVACAPMRSHVNLSHIVRTCGCFGIRRVIACGAARLDDKIARDGADSVELEVHRSLGPVLDRLKREGWQLVGLEQTTGSETLFAFPFVSRTVLVIGNERLGLEEEILERLDRVAEIPMAGLPHSLNAATSTAVAIYEYCRQFPAGGPPPGPVEPA